jgi:hypothetical protein
MSRCATASWVPYAVIGSFNAPTAGKWMEQAHDTATQGLTSSNVRVRKLVLHIHK